jgi:SAM-dependent methyltransferase
MGGDAIACEACGQSYAVSDGIPELVPPPGSDQDAEHLRRQAEFFEEGEDPRFELTRPHGEPAFYVWLMEEKFRRSISHIADRLDGASVLTVCGGSGMDAEFLARAGADVVCSDLSLGAVRRARERAETFGVELAPVVADVERLPFADDSFDFTYVHDGLHHLVDPARGLAEMARVARRGVSVTEPARAAATALAVRVGLSIEHEEAGNRVARMDLEEIEGPLRDAGFEIVAAERYAMKYRHRAGPLARAFSRPGLLPVGRATITGFNRVLGSIGNKAVVQAVAR